MIERLSKLTTGYRDDVILKHVQIGPVGKSPTIFDPDSMAFQELRLHVVERFAEAMVTVAREPKPRYYVILRVVIDR